MDCESCGYGPMLVKRVKYLHHTEVIHKCPFCGYEHCDRVKELFRS